MGDENINRYELMIAVRPDLSPTDYTQIEDSFREVVEKHRGKVSDWQIWAEKRSLAYPLHTRGAKKMRFNEATYILVNLSLSAQELSRLKYTLDLDERVLRFLIIRKKKRSNNGRFK